MPVDVAVAVPAFLDLTFVGLEGLPGPGEERFAGDLVRSPGGGAIHAIATARLGLSSALATPLGDDADADYLRDVLHAEGVLTVERRAGRTATTVVMPVANDRAMVTLDPGVRANAAEVAALEPRAVAANVDMLHAVPSGVQAFVTCGDDDARAFAAQPLRQLEGVHVLFVSEREALTLSARPDLDGAFECLNELAASVVVTLGASGATGIVDGERVSAEGIPVGQAVDTTGAGDLLVSAYIWAELRGASPEDRLRWAVLYSALSVTTPTAVGGALTEERLLAEGERFGLSLPAAFQREMVRSMLLHAKVDYCPVVHGGCGEPLEWTPSTGAAAGQGPATDVEEGDDSPSFLEATCGSCGHHWSLPPGVT